MIACPACGRSDITTIWISDVLALDDQNGDTGRGLRDAIRSQALSLGFDDCGFTSAGRDAAWAERLDRFVEAGRHGDMDWMAARREQRSDPRTLWPDARSVIVLALSYSPAHDPLDDLERTDRGSISVYARGRDYHDVVKKRLKALARWIVENHGGELKVFVDTAPVMEKPLAARTRLGWQGKHTNLVSRRLGSWFFLGEIYTTLELAADRAEADHCGSCRACQDICPTRAFPSPYQLDATRCISYLTIEHKGHIATEFRAAMGNRIYGCDDCLAVCPWNKFAERSGDPALLPRVELTAPRLTDLVQLDDAGFRELFRGSPIKRIGRDRFVRNVLIALGNCGDPAVRPVVEQRLNDDSPLVRAMAVWALGRLATAADFVRLRGNHYDVEREAEVRREWDEVTA
jgi:epoxyqueuosine reductase